MLLAATSVKLLETEVANPDVVPRLQVFEQWRDPAEAFAGIRRILTPPQGEHRD
jgi:hypothetical protein